MIKKILFGIVAAILVVAIGVSVYNVVNTQTLGVTNAAAAGQGFGRRGNGQANGTGTGVPQAQAQVNLSTAKSIHGTVSTFSYGTLTIQTDDGQSLGVQLGNSNFAATLGFIPQAGDKVTIYGFTGDQGLFSAITVTMDGTGKVYTFRDAVTGRPKWGGGNGNGGVNH